MRAKISAVTIAALLAGCTVGPNYRPNDGGVPARFAEAAVPGTAPADLANWWRSFNDAELTSLIERAEKTNPNVQIAAVRIREARIQEVVARAQGKPTLNANAGVSRVEFSKNAGFSTLAKLFSGSGGAAGGGAGANAAPTGVALPGTGISAFSLGFDANWEIDVFGGARRGVESARAQTDAAVWNGQDAAVMVAAEVAQGYWALRLDQTQLGVIQDEIARQTRALRIADETARAGLVPAIDVTRQRSQRTTAEARLAPLRADIEVRTHAIALLLGEAPEALAGEFAPATLPALAPLPAVPAGLPSDLLRRRPDIRAAERTIARSTADIGVATADLYPHFSLTGMAQLISTTLATLFSGNSLQLTGAGSATFPLFDWGRRRATIHVREAQRDEAYLQYRVTVLGALRDVEDALAQLAAEQERHAILARGVADAAASERAIEAQFRTGFVAQDAVLNAQVQVLSASEPLAQSDAQLRLDTVALFKALGGGWSGADAATAPVPSP